MKTFLLILLILALLVTSCSVTMLWGYLHRQKKRGAARPLSPELEAMAKQLRGLGLKHLYCKSGRFRLHAQYLDQQSKTCVLLIHGMNGRGSDRFPDAEFYLRRGYNLLFPDLRANGSSQGYWQGMGQYEREDLLLWTEMMVKKLGSDCRIILDGVSMGASAAMLFAGDGRERNLAAVVAEAGYSSATELIRYILRRRYLPAFILLPLARLWGQLLMGYDLAQADVLRAMERNRIPLLLLHGEEDEDIPCYMARRIWTACSAPKRLLTVPGAGHARCRSRERVLCETAMDEFFKELDL